MVLYSIGILGMMQLQICLNQDPKMTIRTLSMALFLATACLFFFPVSNGIASIQDEQDEEEPKQIDNLPDKLSETGFYLSTEKKKLSPDLVPYQVRAPLWTDGGEKERFILVPKGKKIGFKKDGTWDYPEGTRFMFTIYIEEDGERLYLETRMMEKNGKKLTFASYAWDADQKDATRFRDGHQFYANYGHSTQIWKLTPDLRCFRCHDKSSALVLGAKTSQLNMDIDVKGKKVNQLVHLKNLGILEGLPKELKDMPMQVDYKDEKLDLNSRARSYLDVNCGVCHVPNGNGSGTLDLRFDTPMHETGMIKLNKKFQITAGAIYPGKPRRSRLVRRMRTVTEFRMPDELSTVPDMKGIKLISDWIKSR
ncbi:MAG: putative repeat protein (TIGR03806 family) [Planctomycetota bacterium]